MTEATLEEYPPVPAGKIRLAEPGSGVPMAPRTVLAESNGYTITAVGRGFELAGACLRFTERKYVVGAWIRDAFHGRSFSDEEPARAYFADRVAERQAFERDTAATQAMVAAMELDGLL